MSKKRIKIFPFGRSEWYVYKLPEEWKKSEISTLQNLEWDWASNNIINHYFDLDNLKGRTFKRMLSKRFVGILSGTDGKWTSYAWMKPPGCKGPSHLPRKIRKLPVYWIFYCRTEDNYQGMGIFKQSLSNLADWARKKSLSADIYIDTGAGNISSQKAILAVGFRPCGVIRTLYIVFPKIGQVTFGTWLHLAHKKND